MKIGIIGAGRVGCSIGKYLRTKDIELAGYYDVDSAAAKEAAEFTRTESFDSLKQLADQSQIIFITTPDSFIIPVWEQLICYLIHIVKIRVFKVSVLAPDFYSAVYSDRYYFLIYTCVFS